MVSPSSFRPSPRVYGTVVEDQAPQDIALVPSLPYSPEGDVQTPGKPESFLLVKPSLLHIEAHMSIDLHDVCRTRRVAIPSVSIECTIVDDEVTLRLLDQPITPFTIAQSAEQHYYTSQPV